MSSLLLLSAFSVRCVKPFSCPFSVFLSFAFYLPDKQESLITCTLHSGKDQVFINNGRMSLTVADPELEGKFQFVVLFSSLFI